VASLAVVSDFHDRTDDYLERRAMVGDVSPHRLDAGPIGYLSASTFYPPLSQGLGPVGCFSGLRW